MINIIGLNLGHDAGLSFINKNKIINYEFERHLGIKYVCGGNKNSLAFYLRKIKEIQSPNYIGICDFFSSRCNWLPSEIYRVNLTSKNPIKEIPLSEKTKLDLGLNPKTKTYAIKHHLAHAASSFYTSPYKKSLIITVDGSSKNGESVTISFGENKDINILEIFNNITGPRFGAFYEKFSKKIFQDKFSAGKLMGLSSYGTIIPELNNVLRLMLIPNSFRTKVYGQPIILKEKVQIIINETPYNFSPVTGHHLDFNKMNFEEAESSLFDFGFDKIKINEKIYSFDFDYRSASAMNLAATIQKVFQDELFFLINFFKNKYPSQNICFAGGTFLNISSNSKIFQKFNNIYIPPFCSDTGISIGCSLTIKHLLLNYPRVDYKNIQYGGDFFLKNNALDNLSTLRYSTADFYKMAISKLTQGKVIGWINSRYELGPRALGNRSILASPIIKGMKDFINNDIKFRESFRPLAPIIIEEDLKKFFKSGPNKSPFMLYNYKVNSNYKEILKEVLHVDQTARVQTINQKDNVMIYNLLKQFQLSSGIPILFNTSLNVKGKPILNNIDEVYDILKNTKLDSIFFVDNLQVFEISKQGEMFNE